MIVVLDSNVSVSALQFASKLGTSSRALEKAVNEDVIATCNEIDAELLRVLVDKFNWTHQRAAVALQRMLEHSIRVTLHGTVGLCRDPSDDKFLECAERAHADLIITGDNDLLALKSYAYARHPSRISEFVLILRRRRLCLDGESRRRRDCPDG